MQHQSFLYKLISLVGRFVSILEAYAHCDVPCGIYSPNAALLAADTVIKMVEKIQALGDHDDPNNRQNFVRMVMTKEEHAQRCKEELLILWTDYFKPEHLEHFPNLHDKFWKAAKLCSKNKQEINMEAAQGLKVAVQEIAEIFYKAGELKKK